MMDFAPKSQALAELRGSSHSVWRADFCCSCYPKVSCVFGTSVSLPTGDAPLSCRFVFNCSAPHRNHRPIKTPVARTTSGAAPCVVDRWWSSKGSRLQKSNFVPRLHRCSPLPHETTLSNSNPSRVSACSVLLRLAAKQISSFRFLGALYAILFRRSQLPLSAAMLRRTVSAAPRTAASPHSISIGHRVRRNHGRLPSNGFIERAKSTVPLFTASPKRASDKALASLWHNPTGGDDPRRTPRQ